MRLLVIFLFISSRLFSQTLPARWDELVESDWKEALVKSNYTCILPIGILEKHGPHAPIGSDLIHVRELAARATKQEYAVVFPDYFYGQINEAKEQYGTFALSSKLIFDLLQETCNEIGRNGFRKILIVNGHGGNPEFLRFFIQSQLAGRRGYVVYLFDPKTNATFTDKANQMRKSDASYDMHAGENETSVLLYLRPDLVKLERANMENGQPKGRIPIRSDIYTSNWWYGNFPNHYAGDASKATKEYGQLLTEHRLSQLINAIKTVKEDTATAKVQDEYFEKIKK